MTYKLTTLGTNYGGWQVPNILFEKNDYVLISAGVGEDMSFDHHILNKTKWKVFLLDPTPKSFVHHNLYRLCQQLNYCFPINNTNQCYSLLTDKSRLSDLTFVPCALVKREDSGQLLPMYQPKTDTHVSHSIFTRNTCAVGFWCQTLGLDDVLHKASISKNVEWLLKLDVEGAEWGLIDELLNFNPGFFPRCIFVEFHDIPGRTIAGSLHDIIGKLSAKGFSLVSISQTYEATFLRNN